MRLYIDDDSVDPGLIRLLRRDGHDVQIPADVALAGRSAQVHLAHAITGTLKREQRKLAIHWSVNICCSLSGSPLLQAGDDWLI
jgi:hypothetical protein